METAENTISYQTKRNKDLQRKEINLTGERWKENYAIAQFKIATATRTVERFLLTKRQRRQRKCKNDRCQYVEDLAQEAEKAAIHGEMGVAYNIIKQPLSYGTVNAMFKYVKFVWVFPTHSKIFHLYEDDEGCKFWPILGTYSTTCCWAFSSGSVTTYFWDLLQLGFEHSTFRMRCERSNRLRRRGYV